MRDNALIAIDRGVAVIIESPGLDVTDFAEIDEAARRRGVEVVAAGNFSLIAAMAQAAALLVARFLPNREIIGYASAATVNAPSGTARELAERLGAVSIRARSRLPPPSPPGDQVRGLLCSGVLGLSQARTSLNQILHAFNPAPPARDAEDGFGCTQAVRSVAFTSCDAKGCLIRDKE